MLSFSSLLTNTMARAGWPLPVPLRGCTAAGDADGDRDGGREPVGEGDGVVEAVASLPVAVAALVGHDSTAAHVGTGGQDGAASVGGEGSALGDVSRKRTRPPPLSPSAATRLESSVPRDATASSVTDMPSRAPTPIAQTSRRRPNAVDPGPASPPSMFPGRGLCAARQRGPRSNPRGRAAADFVTQAAQGAVQALPE